MSKPKPKVKDKKSLAFAVELARPSLYDIVRKQLKDFDRVQYLHRIIYIGQHNHPGTYGINVQFREVVSKINSSYCDGPLTGLLLQYSKYFCHLIEGSEASLKRHLEAVLQFKNIKSTKVLSEHHHINQRYLNIWTEMQAKAPKLLEPILQIGDQDVMQTVQRVVTKLYNLGHKLRAAPQVSFQQMSVSEEGPEIKDLTSLNSGMLHTSISDFDFIGRPFDTLPEIQCVIILMESDLLQDLKEYVQTYRKLPVLDAYNKNIWPVAGDYVPKNVFHGDFDFMEHKTLKRD